MIVENLENYEWKTYEYHGSIYHYSDIGRECVRCGQYKTWDSFGNRKNKGINNKNGTCKECYRKVRGSTKAKVYFYDDSGRVCSDCEEYKIWDEYAKCKTGINGKRSICKKCASARNLQWRLDNPDRVKLNRKTYNKNNREKILKKKKQDYYENRDRYLAARKELAHSGAIFDQYGEELSMYMEVGKTSDGELLVPCYRDGKMFNPTNIQVTNFLYASKTFGNGYNNMYCSDYCKNRCPVFGKQGAYDEEGAYKIEKINSIELRELAFTYYGQICEICGEWYDRGYLEVHHIIPVKQNYIFEADMDNLIIVCKKHHKKLHKLPKCSLGYLGHLNCIQNNNQENE